MGLNAWKRESLELQVCMISKVMQQLNPLWVCSHCYSLWPFVYFSALFHLTYSFASIMKLIEENGVTPAHILIVLQWDSSISSMALILKIENKYEGLGKVIQGSQSEF